MEGKVILRNRRAFRDYFILEKLEAGISLLGPEVKSLRSGRANLQESYASIEKDGVWLHNFHISPYSHGNIHNHEPLRPRKLLFHKYNISLLRQHNPG